MKWVFEKLVEGWEKWLTLKNEGNAVFIVHVKMTKKLIASIKSTFKPLDSIQINICKLLMCLFKKYLYGLNKILKQLYLRLNEFFLKIGYDNCVYILNRKDKDVSYILLYVDGTLMARCRRKWSVSSRRFWMDTLRWKISIKLRDHEKLQKGWIFLLSI